MQKDPDCSDESTVVFMSNHRAQKKSFTNTFGTITAILFIATGDCESYNPPVAKNITSFISDKGKPEGIRGRKATGPRNQDSRAAEEMRMPLGGNRLGEIARSSLFGTKKGFFYGRSIE